MDITLLFAWPRITQPPGRNSSDIFGVLEQNGNIEPVEGKPYKYDSVEINSNYSHYYCRMASSFVLGHDQPDNDTDQQSGMQSGK